MLFWGGPHSRTQTPPLLPYGNKKFIKGEGNLLSKEGEKRGKKEKITLFSY